MNNIKRLTYTIDVDPAFILQNIIIILNEFEIYSDKRMFKYPEKLASLIYFVSSDLNTKLFSIVINKEKELNADDFEKLININTKAKLALPIVNRMLNYLAINSKIKYQMNKGYMSISLMDKENFFEKEIYQSVVNNTKKIRSIYPSIPGTSFEAYTRRLFGL